MAKKHSNEIESRQLLVNNSPEVLKSFNMKKGVKLSHKLAIFLEIYRNLICKHSEENTTQRSITLRQMYYLTNAQFRFQDNQRDSDSIIMEICNLLRASRKDLGIAEVSRGQYFCMYLLLNTRKGLYILDGKNYTTLNAITQNSMQLDVLHEISPYNPRCILVVEKEGVFLFLWENKFTKLLPCIIVCSKGNRFQ